MHWVELSDIVRKLDYVESYPLGNFLVTCLLHQVRLLIEAEIQGELEKLGHFYSIYIDRNSGTIFESLSLAQVKTGKVFLGKLSLGWGRSA